VPGAAIKYSTQRKHAKWRGAVALDLVTTDAALHQHTGKAGAHKLQIVECHGESFHITHVKGRSTISRAISKDFIGTSRPDHCAANFAGPNWVYVSAIRASSAALTAGQVSAMTANWTVSRTRPPGTTIWLRKSPSSTAPSFNSDGKGQLLRGFLQPMSFRKPWF
jgi:hypothetical protein